MLVYLLKSALLLALLYGGFALLLSRETFHRFNRVALLSVLVASMVLPALQLTMNKPSFLSLTPTRPLPRPLPREGGEKSEGNFEGVITIEDESSLFSTHSAPSLTGCQEARTECSGWTGSGGESEESSESTSLDWKQILTLLYLVGVLASVGIFLVQLFHFWRETKGGTRTRDDEGNTVIIRSGNFSPYSFFHTIVINVSDYEHLREPILAHEQAHIRLAHSWDLLLLEAVKAVQWFNPFVYLLGRDLKAVHEYEADNVVLNLGIDAKTYQLLLVTKAVGNRLQTLGNNLSHHSLKKRIKMMHKNSSNRWLMTKAVVLPALMALAVVAFAKPKTETEEVVLQETQNDNEKLVTFKQDDPTQFNITFPEGTQREKIIFEEQTSSVVKKTEKTPNFSTENVTIKLDGEVVDPHELTDMPASELKKVEQKFPEREINLITTTEQPSDDPKDDDKIYDIVEENAQFPGGADACYRWLFDQIAYPEECKAKGVQGRVFVQFVVNKDGSISDAKILRSPDDKLSEEALRCVNVMPQWTPAKVKGKIVRSRYILPIMFKCKAEQPEPATSTTSKT